MADVSRFVEEFWDGRLDRLRDAAERAQRSHDENPNPNPNKETTDG
jgi:hypothetical protein